MILIADDYQAELELLSVTLNRLKIKHMCAVDGRMAIDLLRKHNFEGLITDYNMPHYNGSEVIKRALDVGVRKIILRSSHSNTYLQEILTANNLSKHDIITICKRDYDQPELEKFLREWLSL